MSGVPTVFSCASWSRTSDLPATLTTIVDAAEDQDGGGQVAADAGEQR